ncbi:MAG TPA: G5 domain-containing protein, partial [Bacillales bacterium]|nr:G5 domain-containing protein [Bacillales bacterium]
NQYKISTDIQGFKPKTIIQYSPLLASGKVSVTTPGKEGNLVKVYREIYQSDQLLKKELIAEDYYPPVYRVEIHSLTVPNNDQSTETTKDTDPQGTESTEKLPITGQNATDTPDSSEMTEQNPN